VVELTAKELTSRIDVVKFWVVVELAAREAERAAPTVRFDVVVEEETRLACKAVLLAGSISSSENQPPTRPALPNQLSALNN
jgi:hypothetical protein